MKKYHWYKIAESETDMRFNENHMAEIDVNGKTMVLGKHLDKLFAFAYKCPHAGGIMSEGWIDNKGNIVCPVHGYRFSLENGYNATGEGYKLQRWPVEQRSDGIFVGIEEGLFSRLSTQ